MRLRSTTTLTALLVLLVAAPVLLQRLGDLRRDAEDHVQAALMSVLLKFHGSQPREAPPPQNRHRQINGDVTEICAETSPEQTTKKVGAAGKSISAKRGGGAMRNDSAAAPAEELQPSAAEFIAVAGVEVTAVPHVQARLAVDVAPAARPEPEVFKNVSVRDVAVAAAPRPPAPPRFVSRTAAPRDLEMSSFSFAPVTGRQIKVLLKHADELEKEMQRKAWQQELIDAPRKISESLKTKLCAEAARKESEAKVKRNEMRRDIHRVVFTPDTQPSEFVGSEE